MRTRPPQRPVQQPPVTIAQAVQGDAVFAVAAQAEIADPDPEGDPQQRFERVRRAAAAGQEVDRGGDQHDDRHVARGLQAVAHRNRLAIA